MRTVCKKIKREEDAVLTERNGETTRERDEKNEVE